MSAAGPARSGCCGRDRALDWPQQCSTKGRLHAVHPFPDPPGRAGPGHRPRRRRGVRAGRLSGPPGPGHRALRGGRHDRHLRPAPRRAPVAGARAAIRDREPRRRRRQYRGGRGRQGGSRRLHAGDGHGRHARDQCEPLRQDALRRPHRFRARRLCGGRAEPDGGQSEEREGHERPGLHRRGEGRGAQLQHGLLRQRHVDPPLGRTVQADDRGGDAARALSGQRARGQRPHRRPGRRDVRQPALLDRAGARPATCGRSPSRRPSARPRSRTSRRSPEAACRASRRRAGSRSSPRRARRPPSSRSSIRRSARPWRRPSCRSASPISAARSGR